MLLWFEAEGPGTVNVDRRNELYFTRDLRMTEHNNCIKKIIAWLSLEVQQPPKYTYYAKPGRLILLVRK